MCESEKLSGSAAPHVSSVRGTRAKQRRLRHHAPAPSERLRLSADPGIAPPTPAPSSLRGDQRANGEHGGRPST